jgi:hypothetical protein
MPCQACDRGRSAWSGQGVKNSEGRLQGRDQDGAIEIPIVVSIALVRVVCYIPNGKGSAIGRWCQCGNGVKDGSRGEMFRGGRFKEDDVALGVSFPRG